MEEDESAADLSPASSESEELQPVKKTRMLFPETWIWADEILGYIVTWFLPGSDVLISPLFLIVLTP